MIRAGAQMISWACCRLMHSCHRIRNFLFDRWDSIESSFSPMPLIESLLAAPEGKTLEFKRDLSSPRPLLKTLVAFSNTAGGKLVLGVGDDKQIVGVADPLAEEERLCNLIADSIAPRLVPNIEMITVEGKTLLIAEVFLSGSRPHFLRAEGPENGVFVRLGSTNRQADRELVGELRRSVEGQSFDELPMPGLNAKDLDLEAAADLFDGIRDLDEKGILTLKLLHKDQGAFVPTKGAVLLFGKDRIAHFPDAWIQCGRFTGTDKSVIFDHIELHDPLPRAVESIMLFLKKHAMRGADLSGIRRKDVWSIPLTILREVVINALVHSDYSQRGAPIRIAFFDDRIEVENPGILVPGLTIEDMKQGVSRIRNPVIARVFRELKLIEQWGSGVRRIFKEAEEQKLPTPEIVEIGMRVRFSVPLVQSIQVNEGAKPGAQVAGQVAGQVERLLKMLGDDAKSRKELMDALGLKGRDNFEKLYLHPSLEQRLIERTIPEKPQSRLQKYRLTEKGKSMKDEV
jgi:predicted HTH transcriptional regulator